MNLSESEIKILIQSIAKEQESPLNIFISHFLVSELLAEQFKLKPRLSNLFADGHVGIIERAVRKASELGNISTESVLEQIDVEVDKVHQLQRHQYRVVFPFTFDFFRVPFPTGLDMRATIRGTEIKLGRLGDFAVGSLDDLMSDSTMQSKGDPLVPMIGVMALEIRARDSFFAVQRAYSFVDTLVSLLQLSASHATTFKMPPLPIGSIRLQNCAFVFEGGKLVEKYGNLQLSSEPPLEISLKFAETWAMLKQYESMLQELGNVASAVVTDAVFNTISIYHNAILEADASFAVLKFWIGLEIMMRLGQDLPVKGIATRLKTAFRKKPAVWDVGVRRLLETRNRIMHYGEMNAVPQDVYFAKILYEFTLGLLLKYGREYCVEPISSLFDMGNQDPETLEEVKRAIEHLYTT